MLVFTWNVRMTAYAELHVLSNFTFLRGASHPEELVRTAAELGYEALAMTDECSVSGLVRAHVAAKEVGLKKLIAGSEFRLESGLKLVVLAQNRAGYTQLCQLITSGRRAAEKGSYQLTADNFSDGLPDCLVLWIPGNQLLLGVEDDLIHGLPEKRRMYGSEALHEFLAPGQPNLFLDIGRLRVTQE